MRLFQTRLNLAIVVHVNGFYVIIAAPKVMALLHKSTDVQGSPFSGRRYALGSVTGMPRAVKPFMTATRFWNLAT